MKCRLDRRRTHPIARLGGASSCLFRPNSELSFARLSTRSRASRSNAPRSSAQRSTENGQVRIVRRARHSADAASCGRGPNLHSVATADALPISVAWRGSYHCSSMTCCQPMCGIVTCGRCSWCAHALRPATPAATQRHHPSVSQCEPDVSSRWF